MQLLCQSPKQFFGGQEKIVLAMQRQEKSLIPIAITVKNAFQLAVGLR